MTNAPLIIAHPGDVDLPALKAQAAKLGADVSTSPFVPPGQMFVMAPHLRRDPVTVRRMG